MTFKTWQKIGISAASFLIIIFVFIILINLFGLIFCQDAKGDTLHVDVDTCDTYWMNYGGTSYLTQRDAAEALYTNSQQEVAEIGQIEEGSNWYLKMWGMEFDTSPLPDDATLTACTLFAYSRSDNTDASCDFYLCIVQGSYTCPLAGSEWDEWEPGVAGSLSTEGLATNEFVPIVFNTDSLSWISKTGTTKLALISDKFINRIEPGDEEKWAWGFRQGWEGYEDYWPYLKIAYTTEEPPEEEYSGKFPRGIGRGIGR